MLASETVLLRHEQRYWEGAARDRGLTLHPDTLRDAATVATVCGAGSLDEAFAVLRQVPGLGGQSDDALRHVDSWLADLYPAGRDQRWGSLQPDRLAEHLTAVVLTAAPDLLAQLLTAASPSQVLQALTVLTRVLTSPSVAVDQRRELLDQLQSVLAARLDQLGLVALRVAVQTVDPTPLLAALDATTSNADPNTLTEVVDALPQASLALAPLAATLTRRLVDQLRPLAAARPDAFLPNLAMSLNNLSNRLGELSRQEDGLAAIEEATTLYRHLAERHRNIFGAALARNLAVAGSLVAGGGRSGEAVAYLLEAAVLANELDDENLLSFAITTLQQEQQVAPEDFAVAWRELTGEEPPDWPTEDPSTSPS